MRPRHPAMRLPKTAPSWLSMPVNSMAFHALRRALLHEAKHVAGNAAHLNFLGTFGDAIAPVVTIDVFERLVARISQAAMHLHGAVGRLATQPVGPVVAHRNLVRYREIAVSVHAPRGLVYERTQHLTLGLQLHQRKLDALIAR